MIDFYSILTPVKEYVCNNTTVKKENKQYFMLGAVCTADAFLTALEKENLLPGIEFNAAFRAVQELLVNDIFTQ